jgi:hypothetical protein
MTVPPSADVAAEILFPGLSTSDVAHATLDGEAVGVCAAGSGLVVTLPACKARRKLAIYKKGLLF